MKKSILFLLLTTVSFFTFAQSNLIIFTEEGTPFYLVLNGVRQNSSPQTNIKVENLTHAYYSVKIEFNNHQLSPITKSNLPVKDPQDKSDQEVTYKIVLTKKGALKLRYHTSVPMTSAPTTSANTTVVNYTETSRPKTAETTTTTSTTTTTNTNHINDDSDQVNVSIQNAGDDNNNSSENVNMSISMGDDGFNMNVSISDSSGNVSGTTTATSTTTTTTSTSTTSSSTSNTNTTNEATLDSGCEFEKLSTSDFNQAVSSIKSKTFNDSKMTVAKQVTKSHCLSSQQVKEITQLFEFENDKLTYAKFAHRYTYNKNKYYLVNDAFDFEHTIQDLNDYINKN